MSRTTRVLARLRSSPWLVSMTLSPQDVDPLSWLVRPWVGVVFAGAELLYGLSMTLIAWSETEKPWLDLLAVVLLFGACVGIQLSSRPLRRSFGPRSAVLPLLVAVLGLMLSAIGNFDGHETIEHWWIPIGVGLVIANCGPYSSALEMIAYGAVLTVVSCVVVWFTFQNVSFWNPLGDVVIAATTIGVSAVAGAVFSYVFVSDTQRALAAATSTGSNEEVTAQVARLAELSAIARLASRVAPFLSQVADAGVVSESDRTNAGQLARQLRTDLVSQANRSWLDALAVSLRIYVVDPDHRANNMTSAQRTAIRGLLNEIQKDPAIDVGSLFIEFRGQPDGSTAVALSLDLNLPEGNRTMMIAPYYLALKTTVRDISWDPVRDLVRFRLPARE